MVDASQITEHMNVVGSDGQHVGTVDNVGIKLTKKDDPRADNKHHYIKMEIVASITDGSLVLNIPAAEALEAEKIVED